MRDAPHAQGQATSTSYQPTLTCNVHFGGIQALFVRVVLHHFHGTHPSQQCNLFRIIYFVSVLLPPRLNNSQPYCFRFKSQYTIDFYTKKSSRY
jgi:hypothetical protein